MVTTLEVTLRITMTSEGFAGKRRGDMIDRYAAKQRVGDTRYLLLGELRCVRIDENQVV